MSGYALTHTKRKCKRTLNLMLLVQIAIIQYKLKKKSTGNNNDVYILKYIASSNILGTDLNNNILLTNNLVRNKKLY